jgi:NAD(P)-dependent dehydrogenase (short-subunit alcohol dehydrogenase family)
VIEQTINDNFMSVVDVVAITRPALTSNSSITVVSSINSFRAFGLPIYSAAKGAVNAFVISIAPQLLAEGIRINAIALGTVEWAGGRDRRAASRKVFRKLSKTIPDGRPLTTEEASRSILSVGIDSPGISGSVTVVDRGQSNFVNLGR